MLGILLWFGLLLLWLHRAEPHWVAGWARPERVGVDAPTLALPCVSYAPFRRPGHSPFDPQLRLSEDQLRDDLTRLSKLTNCIRLYGMSHGLDQVPALAGELGLTVAVGAWISRDEAANEVELSKALSLARQHPGVVRSIIVGNEVLLRRERTPQQLAALLQRARAESGGVPVSYADVWEFWLRHADVLRPHVDFAAIHVLPYWEDDPVGSHEAAEHLVSIVAAVQDQLAPLPVWVAETGWPVRGRQRGPAQPGLREQAQWIRDLQSVHGSTGLDFNFIEGFDQPWKRQLEGVMGGAWGVLDHQGLPRGPGLFRSANGDPQAQAGLLGLALGGLLGAVVVLGRSSARLRQGAMLMTMLGSSLLAGLLGHHIQSWVEWPRNPTEWWLGALPIALILLVARKLLSRAPRWDLADTALMFLLACGALVLLFDARYRMLPWSLVVAVAVLACWPRNGSTDPSGAEAVLDFSRSPARRFMALWLAPAGLMLIVLEGPGNHQAWGVALGWLVLAWAAWASVKRPHPSSATVAARHPPPP